MKGELEIKYTSNWYSVHFFVIEIPESLKISYFFLRDEARTIVGGYSVIVGGMRLYGSYLDLFRRKYLKKREFVFHSSLVFIGVGNRLLHIQR